MFGQHYSVEGEKYTNYFSAVRRSQQLNSFAELIIPKWHIDQLRSVDVPFALSKDTSYWIDKKLDYITNKYKKLRLSYSGGTDSHTILTHGWNKNIYFDKIFMFMAGSKDHASNKDHLPAIKHLEANKSGFGDFELFCADEKDFECWFDKDICFTIPGFEFMFRPHWRTISLNKYYRDKDVDCNISGHDKPQLVRQDNDYYLIFKTSLDQNSYLHNAINFFNDGHVPELAVNQAYKAMAFYKQHMPDVQGYIDEKNVPSNLKKEWNFALGRTPVVDDILYEGTTIGKGITPVNWRHQESMRWLASIGRTDIIEAWHERRKELIKEFRDVKWGIHIKKIKDPLNYQNTIEVPLAIDRIGCVFRLDLEKMVRVPVETLNIKNA